MNKALKTAPNNLVLKAALLPRKGRAVLFARSKKEEKIFYCLGGKIEPGETPAQAAIREGFQEASIRLKPETIRFLFSIEGPCHGYVEGTRLVLLCFDAEYEGEPVPNPDFEVVELKWLTSKDARQGKTTSTGDDILDRMAAAGQID